MKIEILTPNGYENFHGVRKLWSDDRFRIIFSDGESIVATGDHIFFSGDREVTVNQLYPGDNIGKEISSIYREDPGYVYDVLETESHTFIANGLKTHNCGWLGSSGTLISGAVLKLLKERKPLWSDEKLKIYYEPEEGHTYALVADVSRGKSLDYSAFSVIDITPVPYRQVCSFRDNKINATDFAAVINQIAKHYNSAYVLVELNDNGLNVSDTLHFYHEYPNMIYTASKGRSGKKIVFSGKVDRIDRGLVTSVKTKSAGCAMLKMMVEQFKLEINDHWTIEELKTFSSKETSTDKLTYAAEEGKHDDTVMSLVLFGWFASQDVFKHLSNTHILKELRELSEEEIEDYFMPIGIINNGTDVLEELGDTTPYVTEDQFEAFMRGL